MASQSPPHSGRSSPHLEDKDEFNESDLEGRLPPTSPKDSTNAAERNEAFRVRFAEGDPQNPMNFHPLYKAWITLVLGLLAFAGSSGTSIIVPAEAVIAGYLHIGLETAVLLLSLYVLGL